VYYSSNESSIVTTTYDVKTTKEKISIENKEDRSSSSKTWYEIKIPFSIESPEITRTYTYTGTTRQTTYKLVRKKE
jgi:hypothetical protein